MTGPPRGLRRLVALLALALQLAATAGGTGLHALGGHDHEPTACHGPDAPHLDAQDEPAGDCPVCHHLGMSPLVAPRAELVAITPPHRPVLARPPLSPPTANPRPRPPSRAPPLV